MLRYRLSAIVLGAVLVSLAPTARATTWSVPGDLSGTCTIGTPSCDTLADAVAAAAASDTIQLAAGVHVASDVSLDKALIVEGAGPLATFLEPAAGQPALLIAASGVTVRQLTVRNSTADGVRISIASTVIDDTEFNAVHFRANGNDGLELSTPASSSITGLAIVDCVFANNTNGLRLASTSVVDGLSITGTTFESNSGQGFYQANDGNTSTLANLLVDGCTFAGNGDNGFYAEELQGGEIANSTFSDNGRHLLLFKGYTTSGQAMGNIAIHDNAFTDSGLQAVEVVVSAGALNGPVDIADNTIVQDVAALTAAVGQIDIRLSSSGSHAAVNVTGNSVQLSGAIAVPAAYAIALRGNGPVTVSGNRLDGGTVGGAGTTPPTAGLYIRSNDGFFGTIPANASFAGACNRITGFTHGVSVFDNVGNVAGGLQPGTTVSITDSVISGNGSGVVTGATPVLDVEDNWWGCLDGPGNAGCDGIAGGADADPFAAAPPACVGCAVDAECSDTQACNGAETCNAGICGAPAPCAPGCPAGPEPACRAAGKAILLLKNDANDGKDKLLFKWIKGDATALPELGAPAATSDYALCIYAGSTAALITGPVVTASASWSASGATGWKYKDTTGAQDGIQKVVLKSGAQGKAKALLKGKGTALPDFPASTLPILDFPVTAQLVNLETDLCLGASFEASDVKKNTAGQLKLKAQ